MACREVFVVLTLLAGMSHAQGSACSNERCFCIPKEEPYVITLVLCSVSSITSQDATIKSLPTDIQFLLLDCRSSNSQSFLTAGIFEKFSQLITLGIINCNISVMAASSFKGLASLGVLQISHSVLPIMDDDTFSHLSQIRYLHINNCNLRTLPDMSHLKFINMLNVSHNNLNQLRSNIFPDEANITIDLSYNNITSLPLGLISRTPHLFALHLKGLPLTELSIPETVQLNHLEILDATGCFLSFIDLSGIKTASGMKTLRLDGVGRSLNVSNLPLQVRLEDLALNNFAVTDTIWQQLNSSQLVWLSLTNNHLTTINIRHIPSLGVLDVSRNNISHLSNATFISQIDLTIVNLSHNSIQDSSVDVFHTNFTLKSLDLSYNKISSVQSGVFNGLSQLLKLDLSSNFISLVPYNFFKDLPSMKYLYITNNNLTSLPKLSYMPELLILNVSYNQISSISINELSGLVNLEQLYLNNNRLTSIPWNLLSQCPQLVWALFHHNQIKNIGTLDHHPSLQFLSLNNNQITDFTTPHPFFRLENLQALSLFTNNLTTVNYKMFPPSIEVIWLDKNYIENLHNMSFSNLPRLTLIELTYNKRILSMPSGSVSVFKKLSPTPTFKIDGNVFLCDCNMGYLKEISEDNGFILPLNNPYPVFIGLDNSLCYTPFEGGTIRDFMDVPLSHFACEYNVTWCDDTCYCCSDAPRCECALSCPSECKCYYGGSGLKKFYIHIHCRSKNLEQIPNGIPPRTVMLYLDGNNLSHLSKQDFAHLQNVEDIYLNSSYIKSADNGTFENMSVLRSLFLNDNQLTSIDDNFLGRLPSVKQIYLHDNLIDTISPEAFSQLSSVETITLHNNRLMFLEAVLKIPDSMSLTLSGNPWSCNCEVSKVLMRTFYEIKKAIADIESLCCSFHEKSSLRDLDSREKTFLSNNRNGSFIVTNSTESKGDKQSLFSGEDYNSNSTDSSFSCLPLSHFIYEDHCRPTATNSTFLRSTGRPGFHPGFISLIVIIIVLLLVAVAVVVGLVKRRELQTWVFVKLGVRILDEKVHLDKQDPDQKVFDAFISYSSKDQEFVAASLVPKLENGHNKYRVCVHYRDFPVGGKITDTIYWAIENSSRTILVLSMNFLSSEWCRFEFKTAHHHVLREGSHRLIVVILGDVPEDKLDPDLRVHLKSKTYLKFGDRWFWEKLLFAMPSIKGRQINDGDQRADILQRMKVLAQDELVDREINLSGQQHNPQDWFVDGEINVPSQQHNPEETAGQELNILPNSPCICDVKKQGGDDSKTQDGDLCKAIKHLAPPNLGFLHPEHVVDDDRDKSDEDDV